MLKKSSHSEKEMHITFQHFKFRHVSISTFFNFQLSSAAHRVNYQVGLRRETALGLRRETALGLRRETALGLRRETALGRPSCRCVVYC
jgi:hypothetical protein